MNKLVIDPHGRNHFKFIPVKERELPENEADQIKMVESIYNDLVKRGEVIYVKSRSGSHSIRCVRLNKLYYIVVCMKNEFGTYNNVIYEMPNKNDAVAISVFIGKNIKTMMADYKKQILDAKEMVVRKKDETKISESNNQEENG